MRKNGFTLIELLAVIVILAIIALIAVPLILNVIEKAKKGAFKDSTYGVMKAAEYASLSSRLESNFTGDLIFKFTDGELFNDNGIKLNYNGDTPKDGMLTVRADGKIQLSLTNGEYCARKDFDEIEISLTNISNPNDCEVELAILMAGTSAGIFDPSLGSPLIGPQIESIVFSKSKNVPSEAIGSWDVSEK